MLDMNLWYCVKYIIPPTSGVCLGAGQKAHHFMYTEPVHSSNKPTSLLQTIVAIVLFDQIPT